jgi:hypothetical protein
MQIALYSSIPLQLFPVITLAENALFTPSTPALELKRSGTRVALVAVVAAAAVGIPDFGLLMSLIGAYRGSIVCIYGCGRWWGGRGDGLLLPSAPAPTHADPPHQPWLNATHGTPPVMLPAPRTGAPFSTPLRAPLPPIPKLPPLSIP